MPRHRARALAAFAAGIAVITPVSAQADGTSPARPALTLPTGEVQVGALVELVAKYASCNILVDPAVLHGARPYDFEQPIEVHESSALETLSSLLYVRQFALLPVVTEKRVYEVISLVGPRHGELAAAAIERTVEQVLAAPESKQFVTVVIELEHVNATVMTNSLRPLFAATRPRPGVTVPSVGDPKRMVMTGFQHHIASAIKVVQRVDQPRVDEANADSRAAADAREQQRQKDVAFKLLTDRLARLEKRLARIEKLIEPIVGKAADAPATKAGKAPQK